MDGTGNRYVQRKKSDSERQTQHVFPHMGIRDLNLGAYVHMYTWGVSAMKLERGHGRGKDLTGGGAGKQA